MLTINQIRFWFSTRWNPVSIVGAIVCGVPVATMQDSDKSKLYTPSQTGGYVSRVLDDAIAQFGGDYDVVTINKPRSEEERHAIEQFVRRDDVLISWMEGMRTTVILADNFKMSDLPYQIMVKEKDYNGTIIVESKHIKRLKSLFRFERIWARLDGGLHGLVLRGVPELDGGGVISRDLFTQALDGSTFLNGDSFRPEEDAFLKNRLQKDYPIMNARGFGELVAAEFTDDDRDWLTTGGIDPDMVLPIEAGTVLNALLKGNFVIAPLRRGLHFLVSEDGLKSEVYSGPGTGAYVLFTPQGPKEAKQDPQTILTNPFLAPTVEEAEVLMDDSWKSHLARVTSDSYFGNLQRLAHEDFNRPFRFDGDAFGRMFRYRQMEFFLRGGLASWSPWITERQALTWVAKIGKTTDDRRDDEEEYYEDEEAPGMTPAEKRWTQTMKIPIPFAYRVQIVSQAFCNLAGVPIQVEDGDMLYCPSLKVEVVSNHDYTNRLIGSHGGSDQDDFYVVRYVTINGEKKKIATRNPLTRGEYTLWNFVDGDKVPVGDRTENFPPLTKKRWPKQILKALEDGDTQYVTFPSERRGDPTSVRTRPYSKSDFFRNLRRALDSDGGVGTVMVPTWLPLVSSITAYPPIMMNSETQVDIWGGEDIEDQDFSMDIAEGLISQAIAEQWAIDPIVANRIKERDKLNKDDRGILSRLKRVMERSILDMRAALHAHLTGMSEPQWLYELGRNDAYHEAAKHLVNSRRLMGYAKREQHRTDLYKVAEEYLLPIVESIGDPLVKAKFMLALWHACWTIKTRQGRRTDQVVMGTDLFPHLVEALTMYGILRRPYLSDDGRIRFHPRPTPYREHLGMWRVRCNVGGEVHLITAKGMHSFLANGGVCKTHRS